MSRSAISWVKNTASTRNEHEPAGGTSGKSVGVGDDDEHATHLEELSFEPMGLGTSGMGSLMVADFPPQTLFSPSQFFGICRSDMLVPPILPQSLDFTRRADCVALSLNKSV